MAKGGGNGSDTLAVTHRNQRIPHYILETSLVCAALVEGIIRGADRIEGNALPLVRSTLAKDLEMKQQKKTDWFNSWDAEDIAYHDTRPRLEYAKRLLHWIGWIMFIIGGVAGYLICEVSK